MVETPKNLGNFKVVGFYDKDKPYGWMANTYDGHPNDADRYPIRDYNSTDSTDWPSAECFFQAMKYQGNTSAVINYKNKIYQYGMAGQNLRQFPQMAQRYAEEEGLAIPGAEYPNWAAWWHGHDGMMDGEKHRVMKYALQQKIWQNPALQAKFQALVVSPDDCIIVEAIPPGQQNPDKHWADGCDGLGKNELGKLWMEVVQEEKFYQANNQWPNTNEIQAIRADVQRRYQAFHDYRQANYPGKDLYAACELEKIVVFHDADKLYGWMSLSHDRVEVPSNDPNYKKYATYPLVIADCVLTAGPTLPVPPAAAAQPGSYFLTTTPPKRLYGVMANGSYQEVVNINVDLFLQGIGINPNPPVGFPRMQNIPAYKVDQSIIANGAQPLIRWPKWPSLQTYYYAMRYPGNSPAEREYRRQIIAYGAAGKDLDKFADVAQKIADSVVGLPQQPTQVNDDEMLKNALRAKMEQYPQFKQELLALPFDSIIVDEPMPGQDPQYTNRMGKLWMEILKEEYLKPAGSQPNVAAIRAAVQADYQAFEAYRGINYPNQNLHVVLGNVTNPLAIAAATAAQPNTNRIIPLPLIEDYCKNTLPGKINLKVELTKKDANGLYYDVSGEKGNVEYKLTFAPNGMASGKVADSPTGSTTGALIAMIKALGQVMTDFNQQPRELTLTGTPEAIKTMTEACANCNPKIVVVPRRAAPNPPPLGPPNPVSPVPQPHHQPLPGF